MRSGNVQTFFKRVLDLVLLIIGIVVLAIPMLIIAGIIKIDSSGPFLKTKTFWSTKRILDYQVLFYAYIRKANMLLNRKWGP